jgi:hypothetical protein
MAAHSTTPVASRPAEKAGPAEPLTSAGDNRAAPPFPFRELPRPSPTGKTRCGWKNNWLWLSCRGCPHTCKASQWGRGPRTAEIITEDDYPCWQDSFNEAARSARGNSCRMPGKSATVWAPESKLANAVAGTATSGQAAEQVVQT